MKLAVVLLLCIIVTSVSCDVGGRHHDSIISQVLLEAYNNYKDVDTGKNADYIEELLFVDSKIFGIAIVTVNNGSIFSVGDNRSEVTIQSVSKPFTLSLVMDECGPLAIKERIGVDATGE